MKDNKKICLSCKKEILATDKFCVYCGGKLDKFINCMTCGNTIYKSDKYCVYCGHKLGTYQNCNNCGQGIPEFDKYCVYCGKPHYKQAYKLAYETDENITQSYKEIKQPKVLTQEDKRIRNNKLLIFASIVVVCLCIYLLLFKPYQINYSDNLNAINNNPTSYYYAEQDFYVSDLNLEGYKFLGWYKDSSYTSLVNKIDCKQRKNITLYAKWTPVVYSLTLNDTTGRNKYAYTIEDEVSLYIPTQKGYTFNGWYDSKGNKYSKIEKGTTGNLTLEAKWQAKTYTLSYVNTDNATNPNPRTIKFDQYVKLEALSDTRMGYKFEGWYLDVAMTDKPVSYLKNIDTNTTLYAKWSELEYLITYLNCDGAINNNPRSYNVNTASFSLTNPTKKGYTFNGWYDQHNYRVTYVYTTKCEDITLSARWKATQYRVTYSGGYTTNSNPSYYDADDGYVYLNNPTRTGYTFNGWYDNKGNRRTYIYAPDDEDITLTARWIQNSN